MATGTRNGKKQRPVFSKSYWPISVAVFEHKNSEDNRLNHSVRLSRTFRRNEESDWETTEYLSVNDLLPAAKLLAEAYDVIQDRLQKAYADRGDSGSADQARGENSF